MSGKLDLCGCFLCAVASVLALTGCNKKTEGKAVAPDDLLVTKVERRNIVVQVTATGSVEPIRLIEIKSKASGEIIGMPVETGDVVQRGALLVQVDTTDAAVQLREAVAAFDIARAKLQIAMRDKQRSDTLLERGMISPRDHDQSELTLATERAEVIRADADLARARESRDETIVRAPSAGTILEKKVELGQIITSATGGATEGTKLMTMADLRRVQVRALVDETEIGRLSAGLDASLRVDAYPKETFTGRVRKIEPQGKEERDVTFFAVLIEIDNERGLLRPNMNANIDIHIAKRDSALALSNVALKAEQDAINTAPLLGINKDTLKAMIAAAKPKGGADEGPQGPERTPEWWESFEAGWSITPTASRKTDYAVVFVRDSSRIRPVVVKTGLQNWDYTEIVDGLSEGATAIIPPSATLTQQFEMLRENVKKWTQLPGQK